MGLIVWFVIKIIMLLLIYYLVYNATIVVNNVIFKIYALNVKLEKG